MNENSSTNPASSSHNGLTAEAISRRAYELWEQEGRPESRDLHHWLRAEQELLAERNKSSNQGQSASTSSSASSAATNSRSGNTDTQPLQGTRAGAAAAKAAPKRAENPFPAETAGGRFVKGGRSGGK